MWIERTTRERDGMIASVSTKRRYRLRSKAVGLTFAGWGVVVLALVAGVIGLALALLGHDSTGGSLMGATGIVLGLCVVFARVNDRGTS